MQIRNSRAKAGLITAVGLAIVAMFATRTTNAQQQKKAAPPTGYISGVVQGEKGPEAGVWVIAETKDLPTGFIKTVVTDDAGKFVVPELPAATYKVWSRGYGIVDTASQDVKPGATNVTIKAVTAKTPAEAAKVYPGNYWLSMMAPPPKNLFPGTGPQGNGVSTRMPDQEHWINSLKSDCNFCHQLGNALTRDVEHVFKAKPELKTHAEAWDWRLGVGVRGTNMYSVLANQGKEESLKVFSDWSERIAKGETPAATPPRPTGIERNIVSTQWDIGDDHSFMHDQVSTDKNHPTVNGGGPMYAVNAGHGAVNWVDPRDNSTGMIEIPTREAKEKVPSRFPAPNRPSMFWGMEHLWSNPPYNPADPHNPMLDSKGRLWLTSKIRANANPGWCKDKSNKFSDWFPLNNSGRQAAVFMPATKEFSLIDTCFATHHLQFDNDADETLYFNELIGPIVGWIDTKVYDQTKNEQQAVGWCGQVVDTNGDGKITRPWNIANTRRGGEVNILYESDTGGRGATKAGQAPPPPAAPVNDPKLDTQISYSLYSVIPSPVDDSVWGVSEVYPGYLVRVKRGNNAPETCTTQVFKVPEPGYDPRGVDIDSNGVVWTALAATSHLASFDIRKCKDLTGPQKIDGSQCKEGWTLYQTDGPKLKGTDVPADFHYYNWVDQHDIIGLGKNTPIVTGSNSDSLIALNPNTKKWTYFRIPYPLGFYARGLDGRMDSANADWKGRALYSNYGTHFVWHIEGGKGTKGKIVKFQIRPNPLAR